MFRCDLQNETLDLGAISVGPCGRTGGQAEHRTDDAGADHERPYVQTHSADKYQRSRGRLSSVPIYSGDGHMFDEIYQKKLIHMSGDYGYKGFEGAML